MADKTNPEEGVVSDNERRERERERERAYRSNE